MKAIIRISDLQILGVVMDSAPLTIEIENPTMELTIPEDMDPNCIIAEMDGEEVILSESASKLQQRRNAKLDQLRLLREDKLKAVDLMINELALELRADKEAVKNYRQALLDITSSYKKVNGDAKVAIDNLDLDDESIWPEEI